MNLGETLKFDADHFQSQLIVGHFISAIEIGHSVLLLCQHEKTSDSKVLLRTMFETVLCLRAAVSSEAEANRQKMGYAVQSLKKLKKAKAGNRILQSQYSKTDLDHQIAEMQLHIGKLQANGIRGAYSPTALFNKYANQEEYEGLYGSLSEQSHATFEAIMERNVTINKETLEFEFTGFKQPPIKILEAIVVQTANWIELACIEVRKLEDV